eukprot:TRINITY_DN8372_c0_g1_i1.p1 TRINITY_DN8372_c0_g1~~TRINITY_DN8372_c0_g1_i1.p1  ORF type:complete len:1858 (-),score=413.42 TRINITY_DN8372_c0_g1_i1:76-5649(-)
MSGSRSARPSVLNINNENVGKIGSHIAERAVKALRSLECFKESSDRFVFQLAAGLQAKFVGVGEVLAREGDEITEVYLLRRGDAEGYCTASGSTIFGDDSVIGDPLQLLQGKAHWPYTVTTFGACDMQVLRGSELRRAAKMHGAEGDHLRHQLQVQTNKRTSAQRIRLSILRTTASDQQAPLTSRRSSAARRLSTVPQGYEDRRLSTLSAIDRRPSTLSSIDRRPSTLSPGLDVRRTSTVPGAGPEDRRLSTLLSLDRRTSTLSPDRRPSTLSSGLDVRRTSTVPGAGPDDRRLSTLSSIDRRLSTLSSTHSQGQPLDLDRRFSTLSAIREPGRKSRKTSTLPSDILKGIEGLDDARRPSMLHSGGRSGRKRSTQPARSQPFEGLEALSDSDDTNSSSSPVRSERSHKNQGSRKLRKLKTLPDSTELLGVVAAPSEWRSKRTLSVTAGSVSTSGGDLQATPSGGRRYSSILQARRSTLQANVSAAVAKSKNVLFGSSKKGVAKAGPDGWHQRSGKVQLNSVAEHVELPGDDNMSNRKTSVRAGSVVPSSSAQHNGHSAQEALKSWTFAMQDHSENLQRDMAAWLGTINFFSNMDAFFFERLMPLVEKKHFRYGEKVLEQGGLADAMHVIYAGQVRVIVSGQVINTLGPKTIVGERAMAINTLEPPRCGASIVAGSTVVVTVCIARTKLTDVLTRDPWMAKQLEDQFDKEKHARGERSLQDVWIFKNVESHFAKSLEVNLVQKKLAPGEVMIKEGDRDTDAYLVSSGSVTISQGGAQVATVTVEDMGDAIIFGEFSLLGLIEKRGATVEASTECKVHVIMRNLLRKVLDEYPSESWIFRQLVVKQDKNLAPIKESRRDSELAAAKSETGEDGDDCFDEESEEESSEEEDKYESSGNLTECDYEWLSDNPSSVAGTYVGSTLNDIGQILEPVVEEGETFLLPSRRASAEKIPEADSSRMSSNNASLTTPAAAEEPQCFFMNNALNLSRLEESTQEEGRESFEDSNSGDHEPQTWTQATIPEFGGINEAMDLASEVASSPPASPQRPMGHSRPTSGGPVGQDALLAQHVTKVFSDKAAARRGSSASSVRTAAQRESFETQDGQPEAEAVRPGEGVEPLGFVTEATSPADTDTSPGSSSRLASCAGPLLRPIDSSLAVRRLSESAPELNFVYKATDGAANDDMEPSPPRTPSDGKSESLSGSDGSLESDADSAKSETFVGGSGSCLQQDSRASTVSHIGLTHSTGLKILNATNQIAARGAARSHQIDTDSGHKVKVKNHLFSVRDFAGTSRAFLRKLEAHQRFRLYVPDQHICKEGDELTDVLILQRGKASVELYGDMLEPIEGPCVVNGLMSLLTLKVFTSVKAINTCFVSTISKHHFANGLDEFAEDRKHLFAVTNQSFQNLCDDFSNSLQDNRLIQNLLAMPLLRDSNPDFISGLVGALTPQLLLPGQIVIQEGSEDAKLYILFEGYCHVLAEEVDTRKTEKEQEKERSLTVVGTISNRMIFGEMDVFGITVTGEDHETRRRTVKTVDLCKVGTVPKKQLLELFHKFPGERHRFERLVHNRLEETVYDRVTGLPCFSSMPSQLISQICFYLDRTIHLLNVDVVVQKQHGDTMFIVNCGKLDVIHGGIVVTTLLNGKAFGSPQLLGVEREYHATLRTKRTCQLLQLSRKTLQNIAQVRSERQWLANWRESSKVLLESELKLFRKRMREWKQMMQSNFGAKFAQSYTTGPRMEFLRQILHSWLEVAKLRALQEAEKEARRNSSLPTSPRKRIEQAQAMEEVLSTGTAPLRFCRGLKMVDLQDTCEGLVSDDAYQHWAQSGRLDLWKGLPTPTWLAMVRQEIPKHFMERKAEARGGEITHM